MKKNTIPLSIVLFALFLFLGFNNQLEAQQDKDYVIANNYFKEVDSICDIDQGKLWGINLKGPIMFVYSDTRKIIANQEDNKGKLTKKKDVYIGTLPDSINIANTSFNWNGQKWTMVMWDTLLYNNKYLLNKLLIHESWHRVEDKIGIVSKMSNNFHLEELNGIVLIKLELRALNRALISENLLERNAAIEDAIKFRAYRQSLFPNNNENEFEQHEGMAEYTGFKLCGLDNKFLPLVLSKQLKLKENDDAFANSFAYLTGPAYGILLDIINPGWIKQVIAGQDIPTVIKNSLNLEIPSDSSQFHLIVEKIGAKYNAKELINEEKIKLKKQEEQKIYYKKKLTEGNQLVIKNNNINFSYNPSEKTIVIENIGIVYKTMRLTGDWGILEVKTGY